MIYDEVRNCYTLTKLEENCIKLHIENEQLQKKLDIAVKALQYYADKDKWDYCLPHIELFYSTKNGWYNAEEALKEIDLVGTSVSLAK